MSHVRGAPYRPQTQDRALAPDVEEPDIAGELLFTR